MNEKINCIETNLPARSFAVIGHPIGHTMSPFIHNKLFALSNGCGAVSYHALDISPEELESSMPRLRKLCGFNITIPHKQAIIPHLDNLDAKAAFFHSVNTVKNENGRLTGYTTDGAGFTKALESAGVPLTGRIAILGAGGASRVMAFEALDAAQEPDITIAAREHSLPAAQALCNELEQVLQNQGRKGRLSVARLDALSGGFDLLVNGTPVGMYPHADASPVSAGVLAHCAAVFDAVYNPDQTMLLRLAKENGAKTVGGMRMLVGQAAAAHEIWYGATFRESDIDALCREAVEEMERIFA